MNLTLSQHLVKRSILPNHVSPATGGPRERAKNVQWAKENKIKRNLYARRPGQPKKRKKKKMKQAACKERKC